MKELIAITAHEGKQAVNARELHAFLGSKQEFANWIKNRIRKYGLIENEDFVISSFDLTNLSNQKRGGDKRSIEYILSLGCAKELAMIENNTKGREARKYFIACEEKLREVSQNGLAGAAKVAELENRLHRLEAQSKPIPEVTDFTVFGYAGLIGKRVYGSEASSLGKKAAKRCREEKVEVGKIKDHRFGMVNVYPEWILDEVFNDFFSKGRF